MGAAYGAGVWPEQLGSFALSAQSETPIAARDRALFAEHGLAAAERARYVRADGRTMVVDLYRFAEAEPAAAAYLWLRPAEGVEISLSSFDRPVSLGDGLTVALWRNYVLGMRGAAMKRDELTAFWSSLPRVVGQEVSYAREHGTTVRNSGRRLVGPVSLDRFLPRVPPSVAAFRLGTTGEVTSYETTAGRMRLAVFHYPAEAMALMQEGAFRKLPGATVLRRDAAIGVIFDAVNREEAEALLAREVGDEAGPAGAVTFDPYWVCGEFGVEGGMALVVWGWLLGAVVGFVRSGLRGADVRLSIVCGGS